MNDYQTLQEEFWAGDFGTEYISRNKSQELLASNLNFFSKTLKQARQLTSCIEFGANIGMNLKALKLLYPKIKLSGIEINSMAAKELADLIGSQNVFCGSIFDYNEINKFDLVLIKGVLIHINPDMLSIVYQKLYNTSSRYILVCEYYNPTPVTDGFSYRRDEAFPQDDITWFLLQK